MKLEKVILTGPTGTVGMALIEEMVQNNIHVTAVCRKGSLYIHAIPVCDLVDVVECDLEKIKNLKDLLSSGYDAFFHFAWDGTYGASRMDLTRQVQNVLHALEAVDVAKALGCKVFVGAGSQSEFGKVQGTLRSDMPCMPDNGYGMAKWMAGGMTRLRCQTCGMRHEWVRIVSTYGKYDKPYTMIMSSILKMLRGEKAQFTKGEQVWDYIYNKDAARAFRLVAEKGKDGAIYVLGTGQTQKLKEYILMMRDAVDPELEIGLGELEYYPNQVMHLEADIANLTADTGFIPQYSFEEGIRETVDWAREHSFKGGCREF